ncbi:MAG TPA: peptidylprolyl isomerase [Jiangellaceae bacterium]|nr:peptidylprolyl isomerase [Jiangellaceae bacterium]
MASTSQRRRQLARQRWEKQQARRAAAAARARRRRQVVAGVTIVALLGASIAGVVVWSPWSGDDATTTTADEPTEAAADGTCTYAAAGTPDDTIGLPPEEPIAASTATLTLDGEPVTMELLPDLAPCTVSSLAHLAANDYFDGTSCHRLTSSPSLRVLQCGDPTGSGSGGPGYEFGLENTDGATYPAGTVAMAHRSGEPGSNGSQFFLVYDDSELPPEYTVFGHITGGLDVIAAIAAQGTADGSQDGAPKQPVTLDDLVTAA